MGNVTTTDLVAIDNSSTVNSINNNVHSLRDEFDKVVYKDGREELTGNLDANGKRILNLPAAGTNSEPVILQQIEDAIAESANSDLLLEAIARAAGDSARPTSITLAALGGSSLVGIQQTGTGAVLRNVQDKLRAFIFSEDFSTLQAAIDEASAQGGGEVLIKQETFSTAVTVPNYVNIVGFGQDASTLTATHPNANLKFVGENRGGVTGGFTLDGDGLATVLFDIELCVGRTFQDMKIWQANGIGTRIKGAQNCLFLQVNFEHCLTDNFVLDLGAGNNIFVKCEFNRGGDTSLKIIQSGVSPTGAFTAGPTSNHFIQCVVERLGWVAPGNLGDPNTGDNIIYIGAGSDNRFTGGSFGLADSTPALTTTKSMIKLVRDNISYPNQGTVFDGVSIQGDAPYTTAFEVDANCELILQGYTKFENHLNAFKAADTASIKLLGIESFGTVTNKFANLGAGTAEFEAIARHDLRGRRDYKGSDVLTPISTVALETDANAREIQYPFTRVFGDGTNAARAFLGGGMDYGVPTLRTGDFNNGTEFQIQIGSAFLHVSSVAGPPVLALPNGSISISTNGNGAVYIRIAGAWQTLTIP